MSGGDEKKQEETSMKPPPEVGWVKSDTVERGHEQQYDQVRHQDEDD